MFNTMNVKDNKLGVRDMEEKFLNELPESERLRIGELVKGIAINYRELLDIFYVYEDQNGVNVAIDRKIQSAEEIMDSFKAWTRAAATDSMWPPSSSASLSLPGQCESSLTCST